jgi:hypothetical protein
MLILTLLVFFTLAAYSIDQLVRGIWLLNTLRARGTSLGFLRAPILNNGAGPDSDGVHQRYWLCRSFIGKITEPIQRLVFYSFSVWILFIFSRSHLFDGWHTPFILYVVFSIYAALIAMPAIILRYSAEKFRSDAVSWFNRRLIAMGGADASVNAKQLESIRNQIAALKTGAFAPFSQQPLVQAALALIGSVSGLMLLEQHIPF